MVNLLDTKQLFFKSRHNLYPFLLIFFIIGFIAVSLFSFLKINTLQQKLKSEEQKREVLKDQIRTLSDYYRNPKKYLPTPTPLPLRYVPRRGKEYRLDCYDMESKKAPEELTQELDKKIEKGEKISYLCNNPATNQIAFISQKDLGSARFQFKIQTYDNNNSKLTLLTTSQGSYLAGWCGTIEGWSDNGDIYYQCGGGDGPWGNSTTFMFNVHSKEKAIIESSSVFGDKEINTTFCDNIRPCKSGYFCDLESSSCVKYCNDARDCVNSTCSFYGPVRGCRDQWGR